MIESEKDMTAKIITYQKNESFGGFFNYNLRDIFRSDVTLKLNLVILRILNLKLIF